MPQGKESWNFEFSSSTQYKTQTNAKANVIFSLFQIKPQYKVQWVLLGGYCQYDVQCAPTTDSEQPHVFTTL